MQMTQFLVILVHAAFHAFHAGRYWTLPQAIVQVLLMVQMLWMFGDFFKKAYGGKSSKSDGGGKSSGGAKGDAAKVDKNARKAHGA